MKRTLHKPASVSVLRNSVEIGEKAADIIIQTAKQHPDAVILLPTGATPLPMYTALVRKFGDDNTLDLSRVRFFNLDEYVGIQEDHPLSYSYYMRKVFYEKLDRISPSRAPLKENRHIPSIKTGRSPSACAAEYDKELSLAVASTGRKAADLAVLGIGGAYPAKSRTGAFLGIRGGHVGFNEPGSRAADRTRVVKLTAKTRIDTAFRFMNLGFCRDIYEGDFYTDVPEKAITLGIANILESNKVLLLANMEEKEPVVTKAFEKDPDPDFPATFLKYHENVHWLIDRDAASNLPHIRTPWTVYDRMRTGFDEDSARKAVVELLSRHPGTRAYDLTEKMFASIGVDAAMIRRAGGIDRIKKDAAGFLSCFINSDKNKLLPHGKRVLVFSPHPDDDSIDMAHTVRELVGNDNEVWIVYMVSGENAVRNKGRAFTTKFKEILADRKAVSGKKTISRDEREAIQREARIKVREDESRCAAKYLGVEEKRMHFLRLPYYYHRGLVGVDPISLEKDVVPVRELLLNIRPHHIFYSAEADPHGAHGLCAEIISMALNNLISFWNVSFWGYRGAYEEWSLHRPEDLVIVPFGGREMENKIKCIKCHKSQLDPVFPSFDRREFYQRARDRNRHTGRLLEQMGYFKKSPVFAEVFRKISHAEFIRTK